MTTLTQGQRSAVVRMWNMHRDLETVSKKTRLPIDAVRKFLETYEDYPAKIFSDRAYYTRGQRPNRGQSAASRHKPSLPTVSILKGD